MSADFHDAPEPFSEGTFGSGWEWLRNESACLLASARTFAVKVSLRMDSRVVRGVRRARLCPTRGIGNATAAGSSNQKAAYSLATGNAF